MISHLAWAASVAATGYLAASAIYVRNTVKDPVLAVTDVLTAPQTDARSSLAFTNVTVIDVIEGRVIPGQTVVVTGNRVQAMGATNRVKIPAGAQVVDATDKYLMPGLWDMHAHLYRSALYPLFVAYGVTGVRQPGWCCVSWPLTTLRDSFDLWHREIAAGVRVGPRSIGPTADIGNVLKITDPRHASLVLDSLKRAGDTFVKFHDDQMDRERYFAIAREARRAGMPIVGHIPKAVSAIEVADSGRRSVEHFNSLRCWLDSTSVWAPPDRDTVAADQRCAAVATALVRNDTWFVPTLYITTFGDAGARYRPRQTTRFVGTMHRQGVRIMAGSDVHSWVVKHRDGLAIHHELALLVDAGLSPLEALRTATLNPAIFMNATDSLGSIAPGKLADLVLLDANPLAGIQHTKAVRAVVANGRYFDRGALDALDSVATAAGALASGAE